MIIVVANSKGGVGKSTLAVHLAAWLHEQGHRVILADCDMQHSSSEWLREAAPEVQTVRLASPDPILDELLQIAREADYVVADGPGSNTETSRALRLRADLALVPCKASRLEVKALAQATSEGTSTHPQLCEPCCSHPATCTDSAEEFRHRRLKARVAVGAARRVPVRVEPWPNRWSLPRARKRSTLPSVFSPLRRKADAAADSPDPSGDRW
jgi:cellulose biosynthesis protein BcsQ